MKNKIPSYTRSNNVRRGDNRYPGMQESHERDPEGKPIADAADVFSDIFYPADAYVIEGGGVSEPSLDDTITANRVDEHDNNDDWQTERAHADILHDEEYGYAGLGNKASPVSAYDSEDAIKSLNAFAASSYKGAQLVRNVATAAVYNTVVVGGQDASQALPILGENWARKRAVIRALATNTSSVLIGNENALSNVIGAGVFILEAGKDIVIENTDSLAVILPTGAVANTVAYVSVIDESYER
jgi:hypothetical protein